MAAPIALGLDFGTESVRAVLVDTSGVCHGSATDNYHHGQLTETLPGDSVKLPPRYALQAPGDWLQSAAVATRAALQAGDVDPQRVVGIGIDFTSCTMLPCCRNGQPLCEQPPFATVPLAWPKLWKHHGAIDQTEHMNRIARQRGEPFLQRYGGTIGLEWFFPKILETIQNAPDVAAAAEVWLEAGDWFVWQLVGSRPEDLTRSSCQAGYKALWSAQRGYPSNEYFAAVHPLLAATVEHKLPGKMRSPGQAAGRLSVAMAERFGLVAGTVVSTATIDAHAAVPGVGVAEPGTMVMVMGTSSCHMLNANSEVLVPGVAGVVAGGILPELFGYETGQAAVGDAFAWLKKLLGVSDFDAIARAASTLPAGAEGLRCLDWMNGCRTPLMDGNLRGAFWGIGLQHGPEHFYQALMEASAFGLRWIVELLREAEVPVRRLVATGGLPHHNRGFVEVYADVLGREIEIHPATQGSAIGAAVLGMLAAGPQLSGFATVSQAVRTMAAVAPDRRDLIYPRAERARRYDLIYHEYRQTARWSSENSTMTGEDE